VYMLEGPSWYRPHGQSQTQNRHLVCTNLSILPPMLNVPSSGGGIGGLTCAIALSKYPDLKVDVYEAASRFAEVGTGFAVWPRPWKVLESLGLGPDLLQATDLKPTDGPGMSFPNPSPVFPHPPFSPHLPVEKGRPEQGFGFYTLLADGQSLPSSSLDLRILTLLQVSSVSTGPISKTFSSATCRPPAQSTVQSVSNHTSPSLPLPASISSSKMAPPQRTTSSSVRTASSPPSGVL
jgi:hypothetical protein